MHLLYLLLHPRKLRDSIILRFPRIINDEAYIKCVWRTRMDYPLNLKSPRTFNEKLQWMKLNDRRPIYTVMVDKYAVKQFVAGIIGEEYIIPTLGVWDKPEDIQWELLPNQFVLKCTHNSGGIIICKDKTMLDIEYASNKLKKSFKQDYYLAGREWPYKNVPRRIIAEQYMEDEYGELRDYKFFCFNGQVKALFIASERQSREEPYFDFFDENFNHLDLRHGHPNSPVLPQKPLNFELMKTIAAKLSKGFPELRVDLYDINGRVYFGELTLFHHNGTVIFDPEVWDYTFGSFIQLPQ